MPPFQHHHQKPALRLLVALVASFTFAGAAQAGAAVVNVPGDQSSIQAGINAAAINDTVLVAAGTYVESVVVNKALTLQGAGADVSIIQGAVQNGPTVVIGAPGAVVDGFSITHDTSTWLADESFGSKMGVQISGGNYGTIRNSHIWGHRTAIDINNTSGSTITGNVIDNNRTGVIMRNVTDNTTFTNNAIVNNFTVGLLFLDAGGGPNQQAANSTFSFNSISGNWYGQVVNRQTDAVISGVGANLKNFSANWYGSASPTATTANSSEPGYLAQGTPAVFGGAITAPGVTYPELAGVGSGDLDITPILTSGTDSAPATPGFQSAYTGLRVRATGSQTQASGRITEALGLVETNGTVNIEPGTYAETATLSASKSGVTIAGTDANDRPVISSGVSIVNSSEISDLTLADLSVKGEVPSSGTKWAVVWVMGAGGVVDLTVDNLLIDGEDVTYPNTPPPTTGFGGRNGFYAQDLTGTVRVEDTVFQNLHGYCLFEVRCQSGTKYPSAIEWVRNTVKDSSGAVTFRGQSSAARIPNGLVQDSTWQNIGPDDNSFGAALKVFQVANLTATGNTFTDVGDSGFFPASEGGAFNFAAAMDVKNVTTMAVSDNTFTDAKIGFAVDPGGSLPGGSLTRNTFEGNGYGIYIPANATAPGTPTIARNRIVGSTVEQVHNGSAFSLNVENNWWGCNTGLNTAGCGVSSGTVDSDPWIVVSATSALDEIQPGANNALTVSLNKNSDVQTVANAVPDGTPVSFSNTGTATGAFLPLSSATAAGAAGSTWTSAGPLGTATLTATVDGQAASDTVDVVADAPVGEAAPVPENPVVPVGVTSGDETSLSVSDPVSGSVEVPAGGNGGGSVSIQEIPSNNVPPGDQPTGFSTAGISFEIHAPTQTTANPLKFTFLIKKAFDSAIQDDDVEVFRNGDLVDDCSADTNDDPATPDPCVDERFRVDPDTLRITVYSSAASFWVIGGTTPQTIIDSGPGVAPANYYTDDASPTFTYHGVDIADGVTPVDANFECDFDDNTLAGGVPCGQAGPSFTPTASFTAAPDLTEGLHTFYVQANDGFLSAGNIEDQEFWVDTVDPNVTGFVAPSIGFANGPSHLNNATSGTVDWTRADGVPAESSGYDDAQCSLDGGAFANCTSGTSHTLPAPGLTQGPHTLTVKLVDNAGNEDATPSDYDYEIDIVAPETTIDTYLPVADPSNSPTASFTFSAEETNQPGQLPQGPSLPVTFQCRLTTPSSVGTWTACNPGNITYPGPLQDGLHTFEVRASDSLGNQDSTPDSHSWTVDRTLPVITLRYPRDGGWYSKYKDVESDWDCTDTLPGFVTGTTSTVPEGQAFPRSTPGTNNFEITCTDNAGNVATSSTTYEIKEFHEIVNHDSPIAYYRLNEPSGDDTLSDFSGNNHDGEFKNATAGEPFGISGDDDTARSFFGEGGYGYVNDIWAPRFSHTLGGWVRFNDTGDAEILDHGYEAGIYLKDQRFVYRMMGVSVTDPGPAVVANQWYFVAGVWTGGEIQLWRTTGTPGITTLPTMVASAFQANRPSSRSTFYIGYGQDVPWLRGKMDEVFYYDSALSTHHINELWLADPPAKGKGDSASAPSSTGPANHSADSTVSVASKSSKAKAKAKAKAKRLAKSLASAKKTLAKLKRQIASTAKVKAATAKVKRLQKQLRRAKTRVRSL